MPFVSIEGLDGSGKTEQVRLLVEHLRSAGRAVLQTKEPDGGHLGAEVRDMLTRADRQLAPAEQLLLVSAARYDHVRSVIRPALAEGRWVVSDRFVDSTYAFQVAVADDLQQLFRSVRDVVVGTTFPDLTIVLDISPEVARARRAKRRDGVLDPEEALRDFGIIRSALIALVHEEPDRCRIVDADRSLDDVANDIWQLVNPML